MNPESIAYSLIQAERTREGSGDANVSLNAIAAVTALLLAGREKREAAAPGMLEFVSAGIANILSHAQASVDQAPADSQLGEAKANGRYDVTFDIDVPLSALPSMVVILAQATKLRSAEFSVQGVEDITTVTSVRE